MDELLTVKEVQDLLKVERLTVYRMLKDGRLSGIKIGRQWRFSRPAITSLLNSASSSRSGGKFGARPSQALPLHCAQLIQDMFAEIANVGVVTVSSSGEQLTDVSNSYRFCNLLHSTEKGRQRCAAFWGELHESSGDRPFTACPAGLRYAHAPVRLNGEPEATVLVGQFYDHDPEPEEERERITRLAAESGLEAGELAVAACSLRTLDERTQAQLGSWVKSLANAFEHIAQERADLTGRLQSIAAMSNIQS